MVAGLLERFESLFWFGECFSVTSWTVASTGVTAGLAWWEAWICVILGHFIAAVPTVMTGRGGAVYHVPFPVLARSSFGVIGAYWPIFNREAMTIVWTGVQMVQTGNCFYTMILAWTEGISKVHDPFSKEVSMTGGRLIGFSIAWLICLGCTFIPVHKFRKVIYFKSVIMSICLLAFFGWSIHRAGGVGKIVHQGAKIPKGKSHGWVFIQQLFIQASNVVTFAANNADLSRYSRRPNDALWTQLIGFTCSYGMIAFFGILITSSSGITLSTGKPNWDPLGILASYLTEDYSSANRAGVFFISAGFAFAQVVTIILANLIQSGNDAAALVPRYISVRRGMIIALVLGFAITPWNLTKTSFSFTTYLSAYAIFLSSIVGVLIGGYFLNGLYYYNFGFNWRGYAAYIIGMIPAFPGFLAVCGHLYYFSFPIGVIFGAVAYWGLSMLSPPPGGLATSWKEFEPQGTGINGDEGTDYIDGVTRYASKAEGDIYAKSADAEEKQL
ncbi:permease for cytosine/purines, uracil, thiamine, allantoin-domain-containing protein [Exophiala viscosa]|uniref:Permease for cytosine/purines, uracil, thiamine, allantoin-domain-containing protein n=1 Tax=Exophiala viscosa TaxID=2486360 RepID=A0AAN6IBM4_9EURO|nr:permease for cytosine/purines, uracil, thiamine, allantoin-domain-containing protein [Exophiala viscosa]